MLPLRHNGNRRVGHKGVYARLRRAMGAGTELPQGKPIVRSAHAVRSKLGEGGLRGHGAALYPWIHLDAWPAPLPTLQAACVALALLFTSAAFAQAPMPAAKTQLVPFDITPFPYSGPVRSEEHTS